MPINAVLKKNLPLAASFILALIAALLVFATLRATRSTVPVLVATKNLSVGATIEAGDVAVKELPSAAVSPSAVRSKKEVEGRTVAYGPILAGEVIREEHLTASGSLLTTLKTFCPKGWAAVELPPETATGMTGLRRGDQVDIYGEVPFNNGTTVNLIARGVVLQNLSGEKSDNKRYIVGVPANAAAAVAEAQVRGKKMALVLPSDAQSAAQPAKTNPNGGTAGEVPVPNQPQ